MFCGDSSLHGGADLKRVATATSVLMPNAQGPIRIAAARTRLEAKGWPSTDQADGVSLAAPRGYVVLLKLIPAQDQVQVAVNAPCATPDRPHSSSPHSANRPYIPEQRSGATT